MKIMMISGITGQIGSYCAEQALSKGYKVIGIKRRGSLNNTDRIDHIFDNTNLKLEYGDITDFASMSKLINQYKPDYFINCAAQSHVAISYVLPVNTFECTLMGTVNILECIRQFSPETKFVTCSSSEQFGSSEATEENPQTLQTPMLPVSPYSVAKLAAYNATINYRESFKLKTSNALLFNSESPRRGVNFFTIKVVKGLSRIKFGLQDKLLLGNLDSYRDFQHAYDSASALIEIVTSDKSGDYILATGKRIQMREFVKLVAKKLDLDWEKYIEISEAYIRPQEVNSLCGKDMVSENFPNWKRKYTFEEMLDEMIESEIKLAKKELFLKQNGY